MCAFPPILDVWKFAWQKCTGLDGTCRFVGLGCSKECGKSLGGFTLLGSVLGRGDEKNYMAQPVESHNWLREQLLCSFHGNPQPFLIFLGVITHILGV